MKNEITSILLKGINLDGLIRKTPELFNFGAFNLNDKISLLDSDPKYYSTLIDVTKFNPQDKVNTLLNLKKTSVTKLIEFSEEELKKLAGNTYGKLVLKDFSYIRVERFKDINKEDQSEIFLSHPQWVLDNIPDPPKFTTILLTCVAQRSPAFIDTHITDFKKYKTNEYFWLAMIKFDAEKYKKVFLENTDSVSTKTQVRAVFHRHPDLVKLLDNNMPANFKLTGKELVILIDSLVKSQPGAFRNWALSNELRESLKLDLTAEMLNGTSTLSRRFQNTITNILKEEENEDKTILGPPP